MEFLPNKEAYRIIGQVRKNALGTVVGFYGGLNLLQQNKVWNEFTLLYNLYNGDHHYLHADNEVQDTDGNWVPNHTPQRNYSAILYLNTSGKDYEGGPIIFPDIEYTDVSPIAGMLVGLPSNHNFMHKTTTVTQGNRFSVSLWMTCDESCAKHWN